MHHIIHAILIHVRHSDGHATGGGGGGEAAGAFEKCHRIGGGRRQNADGDSRCGGSSTAIHEVVSKGGGSGKSVGGSIAVLISGEGSHGAGGGCGGGIHAQSIAIGIGIIDHDADVHRRVQQGAGLVIDRERTAVDDWRWGGGQRINPGGEGRDGCGIHSVAPDRRHLMEAEGVHAEIHHTVRSALWCHDPGVWQAQIVKHASIDDVLLRQWRGKACVQYCGRIRGISGIVAEGTIGIQIRAHARFQRRGGIGDRDGFCISGNGGFNQCRRK